MLCCLFRAKNTGVYFHIEDNKKEENYEQGKQIRD